MNAVYAIIVSLSSASTCYLASQQPWTTDHVDYWSMDVMQQRGWTIIRDVDNRIWFRRELNSSNTVSRIKQTVRRSNAVSNQIANLVSHDRWCSQFWSQAIVKKFIQSHWQWRYLTIHIQLPIPCLLRLLLLSPTVSEILANELGAMRRLMTIRTVKIKQ